MKGRGSRTALPRRALVPSPGQPRPRPSWGGGCCWAPSRPLGAAGGQWSPSLLPRRAACPPASHKMAEGCGGHFVQPQEDKGSRQPGAGRRNVHSGSAAAWLRGGREGPAGGRRTGGALSATFRLPGPGHPEPPEVPSSLPGALGGLGDEPLPGAVARMPSHLTEEAVQREAVTLRGRGGHRLPASQAWAPSG